MIQPAQPELVTVTIDGKEVSVPKGTNVIEAARLVGTDVPHYCYHPKLSIAGNCRMCLIEMGMPMADRATREPIMDPETGKQKIGWIPRPQIGCATNVAPGMHIKTQSPLIKECREGVMEFLLINHPLDCPICDQAGECKLQEQATGYGRGYSRFIEQKNVKPKRTQLGPRVMLDDERCVLCSRCIRFSKEVAKDDVLGFVDRGSYSTLTCYPGKELANNYSLNTVDICPVGALTSTDFRFKMRVWFLKQTNSIDTESSVGANTVVWSREGVIYRITPRRNDEVNDTWMADSGRVLYKEVQAANRLTAISANGATATLEGAIAAAAELAKGGNVAVVGSGRSSVEEQFLTKKLAAAVDGEAFLVGRVGEGDGLLISADRNPNTRGALVTGLIDKLPESDLSALGAEIDAGRVKTIISVGEDLSAAGLSAEQLAKVAIVFIGTHGSDTTAAAKVVIPTLTVFEKNGSFINQQFRLQKFAKAIPGPAGAIDDLVVLDELIAALGGEATDGDLKSVWKSLNAEVSQLANVTYANLPATGLLLDSSAWAGLSFPEGESLHFKPAAAEASA
ncbi:2Fe-2S iron-sulfur cluster-binding protein [Actomonas aquatica]|uniref:2Fe-2S iron-sulfur cluster-binding protein n=1 Tax=Actomonas aquatica TaxID=2866162 RepID=A0ABZ1C528_9BACT|nr:2Fe-2S iron-sulfur cluster-binding protein [Opitutus sp. WL0086]WRQ86833.1 2Fe-2S iron-sulfur cluster-binding protein [Opitutus sp. WL0086]